MGAKAPPARRTKNTVPGVPRSRSARFPRPARRTSTAPSPPRRTPSPPGQVARGAARRSALARGRRDRPSRRADRPGHDARDGQAHPRGSPRGGPDGADPPLLRGRGLPLHRRALRAGGDRQRRVHDTSPTRRSCADHAVELPRRYSGLEGGAGARVREHRRHEARAGSAADRAPSRRVLRGGRHARPASSTSSSGAARPSARRSSRTPTCGRSRSRAPCPWASRCAARRPRSASASSSSSAATTRAIVMADADLDRASGARLRRRLLVGRARSAPRPAASTWRTSVYDDLKQRLLARMERGAVGDPTDPETEVGPIVNESQFTEVLEGIERGKADGGQLPGGRRAARSRTPTCSRPRCSRVWRTTRSSPARRSSGPSRPSTASPSSTRR